VPDALGIQATVNAQAQFDQQRQVALAGRDRRAMGEVRCPSATGNREIVPRSPENL
jgi:hypothetical protein